ncbi:MAG: 2-amino-4-hydroxy-6-hydroxymethyldihydropteridine diphosphokinase [Cyclobacteriaceae bacterium]
MKNLATILLGSNLGNRLGNLKTAVNHLSDKIGDISKTSSVYQTEPWGVVEQRSFLNLALQVETTLSPFDMLQKCLEIEDEMGRKRSKKWGERRIDVDILYINDDVIDQEKLQIPHPRIAERRFTLVMLSELFPEFVHPIYKKSNEQLLKECKDNLAVTLYSDFDITPERSVR